ncbi:OmpP1/FadL family transporter [Sulfuriflexus sp.]|uniref:OmpP1/FadL family transporter n=1 Tax=Sulfuriflexus sp. TaxID=2015443 RepID=UPI0028CE6AF6|nr:outer membrane protein transport protein [Sulfuriflexus sp.]MDT8404276.1 outer membrane protein transport protein [Sulfuriflexus sp.]
MSLSNQETLKAAFAILILGLGVATKNAHAAGFAIIEHSVRGLGNAFAGSPANAEDASTVFFNPAGLAYLEGSQANVAAHIIIPSARFTDQASTHFTTAPLDVNNENGGNAGVTAVVPNFYYSRPLNQQWTFGFGMNAPFGLATDYDNGWVGRYHALASELKTVNLNPSLAFRPSDTLSIGFGVNAQYIEARLTNAVDFGGICFLGENVTMTLPGGTCAALNLAPQANDGEAEVTGDDWSWGYNLGFMWQATPQTRLGAAYRSRVKHRLEGEAEFQTPANAAAIAAAQGLVDTDATAKITLPDSLSIGFSHAIDGKWSVNGDITWTNWSLLDELRIEFDSVAADSVVTTNWRDSNRYSLGVSYRPDNRWTWRAGIALDESPIPDAAARTPRIPDNDRTWVSLGFSYQSSDKLTIDVGYAHLFIKDAKVNKTAAGEDLLRGALIGEWRLDVDIISAQARWAF